MVENAIKPARRPRLIIGVGIMLILAAIHAFRLGSYLNGDLYIYYYSYASDIMLPFGIYFLLTINEVDLLFLRRRWVKAGIVFGACCFTEVMQAFGIYFLGVTFDPFDILMFGIGTMLAVLFEKAILQRLVPSWRLD